MLEIMEHYGIALLGEVGVLCTYAVLFTSIGKGGSIYNTIVYFLQNISG